jgi:DNA polymerase-3 subunit beta
MEISILRKDLLEGLKDIQTIVERRTTLPILNNFLLTTQQTSVEISATDSEIEYRGIFPAKIIEPGSILLPTKKSFEIVREILESSIHLSTEENWINVKAGKSIFRIPGLPGEEYPSFSPKDPYFSFNIEAKVIKEMITKTVFATSQEGVRTVLGGVLLSLSWDKISMVATDGYRLAFVNKNMDLTGLEESLSIIIPQKVLLEVKKIFINPEEQIRFGLYPKGVIFKTDNITLSSLLLEGEFPNYQQVIPEGNEKKLVLKKDQFFQTLKRVSLLSDEQSNLVNLTLGPNRLEISSHTPELGEAKDEIEIVYSGEDMEVCFNAKYLMEGISVFDEEYIMLELQDSDTAAILRPLEDNNCFNVVMPIRID